MTLNFLMADATIIFSDILMIPHGLGQTVEFKKGRCIDFTDRTIHKELQTIKLTPRFSISFLFSGLYA